MTEYTSYIRQYETEFLRDLSQLIRCPSVRDAGHAAPGAPFGPGIRQAFDVFASIAAKCGLEPEDCGGFACHALQRARRDGDRPGDGYVGILGHLDVVEPGDPRLWKTDPYTLTRSGDLLTARGVNDDKGPLLACLYAVRILKDMGFRFRRELRVIAGGAEETTWECMEHYFAVHPQPSAGFSPDGNFPIVNGEKGIVKYDLLFADDSRTSRPDRTAGGARLTALRCGTLENYVCDQVSAEVVQDGRRTVITHQGRRALSRNPQKGDNALWKLASELSSLTFSQPPVHRLLRFINECLAGDYYGVRSGLYSSDPEMGSTSVCPTGVRLDPDGCTVRLYLDIRYPKSVTREELDCRIAELGVRYGFRPRTVMDRRLLYVAPENPLILSLAQAYRDVTGEPAALITKGGASYARALDCGVAFGAAFDGEETNPHMPGERMSLQSLQKATEIYCRAICLLDEALL